MEAFGEFDPATPLGKMFCSRISVKQFEEQASEETYSALQVITSLIIFIAIWKRCSTGLQAREFGNK